MKVNVLSEWGYENAMLGVSLSWASNPQRSKEIAPNLAHKQGGHNTFLEHIFVSLDVLASRGWWQEYLPTWGKDYFWENIEKSRMLLLQDWRQKKNFMENILPKNIFLMNMEYNENK